MQIFNKINLLNTFNDDARKIILSIYLFYCNNFSLKFFLMFSLFLFILAVTAASSSASKASTLSEHVNAVSSTFTTFEKPEDLYKLIYTSYKTGVLSLDGSYGKVLLLDMVKSIPVLKDFCETNEILVGDDLRSDALLTYLNTNFELRNLLVREGVINAAGEYQQAAVHSIIERYNPASGKLDPVNVNKTGKSNIIVSHFFNYILYLRVYLTEQMCDLINLLISFIFNCYHKFTN